MILSPISVLALLCFFFLHHPIFNFADNFLTPFSPVDNIANNCGCFDNNLAGPIPVSPPHDSRSWTPKLRKLVKVFGLGNAIATGVNRVIIVITLFNIVVYYLRRLSEANFAEKNIPLSSSEQLCRRFSLGEIQSATHNFDDAFVIGKGGFGKVYKGLIDDGARIVAIKRLDWNSKQGAHEFWTEIELLSKFRHIHLVSLIGYCHDCHEMILVYEYMPRGTLSDRLHKLGRTENSHMSWEQRLKICIGAARGLDYLHTGTGAQHRVIHRDVKSSNILLDENWVAKISDFGLSKIGPANLPCTHVSTNVKGTFGYLDPEYFLTRRLTRKSDVYAFGVVLFEVLCGRPAVDLRLDDEQRSLTLWAKHCIEEGTLDQIIDSSLRGQISQHCLKKFVEIAEKCLHHRPNERPTMVDVVASLEFAWALQESTNSFTREEEEVINFDETPDNHEINADSSTEQEEVINFDETRDNHEINADSSAVQEEVINFGGDHDNQENMDFSIAQEEVINVGNGGDHDKQIDDEIIPLPNRGGIKKKVLKGIALVKSWGLRWDSPRKVKSLPLPLPLPLLELRCRRFSLAEIEAATNSFHRDLIVVDMYGSYKACKGYIDGHIEVFIRQWAYDYLLCNKCLWNEIMNETTVLSRTHHRHLVSLIGYCYDERATILVYDYMAHGTLHDHLYNTQNHPLSWKQRLQICIGTARGLNYLHTGAAQTIIHRDVKSANILLDENFVAKVRNFELSKLGSASSNLLNTHFSTRIVGTWGYLDPEYMQSGRLTTKSDVYSFGVLLCEVLCAMQSSMMYNEDEDPHCPPRWLETKIRKQTLRHIIDPHLMGKIAPECLSLFIKIALSCSHNHAIKRPSMSDVVEWLVIALQLQEDADDAANIYHESMEGAGGGFDLDWENIYLQLSSHLFELDPDNNIYLASAMNDDAVSIANDDAVSIASYDYDSMTFPR